MHWGIHGQTYPSMHLDRHPSLADISQHALGQTPPSPDDHFSGRYASYWNAFLFRNIFLNCSLYDSSDVASAEEIPAPPNTRASSPTPSVTQEHADIMLPHAEPIPPEHMAMARQWIPVRLFRSKSFSTYLAHRPEVNQFEQISNNCHQISQVGGGSLSVRFQMSLDYSIR